MVRYSEGNRLTDLVNETVKTWATGTSIDVQQNGVGSWVGVRLNEIVEELNVSHSYVSAQMDKLISSLSFPISSKFTITYIYIW